ncbi:hypothetical protein [Eisenbergiella tayi]|uniref:Uncharacterized protein n=1 Tax=Eisenbergiella tayi TaxID=1432052 RepID=A0A1E3A472_9FIRM|nr:hypothetical protein [Eisenbergiella tayi]ODM03181.1 hypothetical protein BEI61_03975 [Eisenbergiella tayi]
MWFVFLASAIGIAGAALPVIWIAGKVILSIKRQYKRFEVEEEAYKKAQENINWAFEEEREDER